MRDMTDMATMKASRMLQGFSRNGRILPPDAHLTIIFDQYLNSTVFDRYSRPPNTRTVKELI